jgi:hypothetical protein
MLRGAGIGTSSSMMSHQPLMTGGGEAARGGSAIGSGVTVVRLLGTVEAKLSGVCRPRCGAVSKLGVELLNDGFNVPSGATGGTLIDICRSGMYRLSGEYRPGIKELHLESRPGK